jgi:hypothetical protein
MAAPRFTNRWERSCCVAFAALFRNDAPVRIESVDRVAK